MSRNRLMAAATTQLHKVTRNTFTRCSNYISISGARSVLGVVLALLALSVNGAAFDYLQPLPEKPLIPEDNPLTDEKITLGKKLFFDKRLSSNNKLSCHNCHKLNNSDTHEALTTGASGKPGKRNPPTLLNIGLQTVLYWDGRATSLEAQAIDHLSDADIMGNTSSEALLKKLSEDGYYVQHFMKAFGSAHPINLQNIAKALASFERALMTHDSPFDRFIKGDANAISERAKQGLQLFNETGCLACHFGVNFAGPAPGPALGMGDGFYELFPNNLGSSYDKSHKLTEDLGRYEFSKDPGEKYMWRVPPLRNIALTAPYFHNGSAKTLQEAIVIMAKTQTNRELTAQQIDAIAVFLESLTGQTPAILTE